MGSGNHNQKVKVFVGKVFPTCKHRIVRKGRNSDKTNIRRRANPFRHENPPIMTEQPVNHEIPSGWSDRFVSTALYSFSKAQVSDENLHPVPDRSTPEPGSRSFAARKRPAPPEEEYPLKHLRPVDLNFSQRIRAEICADIRWKYPNGFPPGEIGSLPFFRLLVEHDRIHEPTAQLQKWRSRVIESITDNILRDYERRGCDVAMICDRYVRVYGTLDIRIRHWVVEKLLTRRTR